MTHRLMVADRKTWWEPWEPSLDVRKAPRRARARLKKAEALLRKFGVWPRRKVERTEWITFSGRSLLEDILRSRRDIDLIYSGEVRRILVGPDSMGPLQYEIAERAGPFSFHERVPLHGPFGSRVFGLDVHYIPWMRGVLLVPELNAAVDDRPRYSPIGVPS